MIRVIIILISIIIFSSLSAFAAEKKEEKKDVKKYTIAVSTFEANNSKPDLARAVTDMLAGKLFAIDSFILLERSQMDLIMQEKGISTQQVTDVNEAARIGKILSVQKMVVGSLSKLGNAYRLEVRVVNVESGSVDLSLSEETADEGGFEKITRSIAENIERYYQGFAFIKGAFDVGIHASVVHAIGRFARGAGFGYGGIINFYWNKPFGGPVPIIFCVGVYGFTPAINTVKSFVILPIEIHTGYKFNVTKNFKLLPWVGVGYLLSCVSYDTVARYTTPHHYSVKYFHNPEVAAGLELNILLHDRVIFSLIPKYVLFFESKKIGHYAGGDFGVKILF